MSKNHIRIFYVLLTFTDINGIIKCYKLKRNLMQS